MALLGNVAMVATAGYVEAAIGLVAGVMIARTLGPEDYGHYAFTIWMCGALILACNNAFPTSTIKFLAEARGAGRLDLAEALVHRLARLQWLSSALVLGVFAVAMLVRPLSDWRDSMPLMLCIALVAVWARAGFWMLGAVGKGFEQFVPENLALGVTAVLNLVLVSILAWRGASLEQFFAVYAVLGLASNLLVRMMLRRAGIRSRPAPVPDEFKRRLHRHLVLTAIVMLMTAASQRAVEMMLLKIHTLPETVAFFAIAGALTKGAVDLLTGGMSAVLLPAMSRRYGSGGALSLASMFAESTRMYWFLGLAIAGLGITVSEGLVHLLYGRQYDGAITPLMWLLVIGGLVIVNAAASAVLTASDRQLDRIRIIVSAFLVNLVLGLVLIPRFGLYGAIASFGLTRLFETLFALWYTRRRTQVRLPYGPMSRLLFAAAVATALAWGTEELWHVELAFVLGAVVFVMAYLSLSIVLRTWRSADFELASTLLSRLGGLGGVLSAHVLGLRRYAIAESP